MKRQKIQAIISWCTVVFIFTISCASQNTESKDRSNKQSQTTEISGTTRFQEKNRDYVPGEILIKFNHGTDQQTIETIQKELHLKTIRVVSRQNLYLMKITDGSSVEKIMERLHDFQEVSYSEPNYIRTIYRK